MLRQCDSSLRHFTFFFDLSTTYLVFNEGCGPTLGDSLVGVESCADGKHLRLFGRIDQSTPDRGTHWWIELNSNCRYRLIDVLR
jgi:hypothetical protein